MITTQSELVTLCEKLLQHSIIAIDTEFDWRSTYFPKLCLIQIATETDIYLIDPLALNELTPLKNVLENPQITKVLHAATYDLKILHQHTNAIATNIFDTQIAAAFLGLGHQMSLNDLLFTLMSITLDKSVKLSNWCLRPLTSKQMQYASEDVKYLIKASRLLTERLQTKNRLNWLYDEINQHFNSAFYQTYDPKNAYLKVKRYRNFRNGQFEYLKALASWREITAIKADIPIRWILEDHAIYQIIYNPPNDLEALSDHFYHLTKKQLHRYGKEILSVIEQTTKILGQIPHEIPKVALPPKPMPLSDELFQDLYQYFKDYCDSHHITSQVIATRTELKQFVTTPEYQKHKLNRNWRYEFIGKKLLKRLKAQIA